MLQPGRSRKGKQISSYRILWLVDIILGFPSVGMKVGHPPRLLITSLAQSGVFGILWLTQLHSHSSDLFTFGFLLSTLSSVGKQTSRVSSAPDAIVITLPRLSFDPRSQVF